MIRSQKVRYWLGFLFLAITLVGAYLYLIFAMPAVHPHAGDGQFENTSWRFPWISLGLPIPGYEIKFEQFDLSHSMDATYEIGDLSEPRGQVGVYFCIADPKHELQSDISRNGIHSVIDIEVTDGTGSVVCHVQKQLGEMQWAEPEGGANTYGLYDLDNSFFTSRPGEKYRVRLKYTPDPKLSGFRGFVFVRSGGSV